MHSMTFLEKECHTNKQINYFSVNNIYTLQSSMESAVHPIHLDQI